MILIYGTHVENVNISTLFIHFFKILIFLVRVVRGKREKNGPKLEKILSVTLHISETIHHDIHLWYTCVKEYLQMFFSFFQNFAFLGC